ncbi:sialoadhesin-like [Misgurnus anguillicaudatus]|uniref:sialoadhesin-like n=1 Tax=Misgurnus anguillicaudatus TaxID=75329 RepID=UPI003CCFCAAD
MADDPPQPPDIIFSPDVSKYVIEGTAVNLNCSAEAPCPKQPPTLSWTNIPKSANIITQLQDQLNKTHSVFSSMTFNVSYMDHKMNISCTATYPRNISNNTTVNSTVMLQVMFPPKETHIIIEPSASVTVGTNVTFTCQSKARPSNNMMYTWYKRGQKTPQSHEKKMSFTVTHNNTGWYFCTALNKHGNQSSEEIQLLISGPYGYTLVYAGCVGGTLAVLLFSVILCMRSSKTINESSVSWRDVSYQRILADDETLIIYNEEIDVSKLQKS